MDALLNKLEDLRKDFLAAIEDAEDLKDIDGLRVKYLGKKGAITDLMKGMGKLAPEERPVFGQKANEIRGLIEAKLAERKTTLEAERAAAKLKAETIDISMDGNSVAIGAKHPLTQMTEEFCDIFIGLGFSIAEGPEIELDHNNFEMLRIPKGHPARDDQDTFYISENVLLRSQTSPVQIRVMKEQKPPIRIVCPGKVFRSDTPDATHSPVFHQIEGLVVDEGISMSDLVGSLELFARELFGEDTRIRLRPHHFPFTEPSCEVDISCWNCHGHDSANCRTCRGEGWIEILGAGMVHPEVLENCGIDSSRYSGFAFGVGVERVTMGMFDITDIRNFYENDLRFLKQFRQGGKA